MRLVHVLLALLRRVSVSSAAPVLSRQTSHVAQIRTRSRPRPTNLVGVGPNTLTERICQDPRSNLSSAAAAAAAVKPCRINKYRMRPPPPPQPVSLQDIRRLLYEPIRRISMRDWVSTLNSLSSRKKRRLPAAHPPPPPAAEPPYEVPEWIAEIVYQTSAHYLPPHPPKFTFSPPPPPEEAKEQFLSTY